MSQNEMLRFGKIYIEKCKFHIIKELTDINDVDIDRILVSWSISLVIRIIWWFV